MDATQYICFEIKKGDMTFKFYMPNTATWGQAWDVSFEIMQYMNKQLQQLSTPQAPEPTPDATQTPGA